MYNSIIVYLRPALIDFFLRLPEIMVKKKAKRTAKDKKILTLIQARFAVIFLKLVIVVLKQ